MIQQPTIAAFLPAAVDACALYRMYIPHLNVPGSRFVFKPGAIALEDFVEASVAVVQRQATINNYAALQHLKQYGMQLVYDLDDNIWAVPAYNPAAAAFRDMKEGFGRCAELCDVITVSTRGLQTAVKTSLSHLKSDIVIIPNAIDFRLFQRPVCISDNRVVIGWAGSNTHSQDVRDCWDVLPDIVLAHDNVYLDIVGGARPPDKLLGHPRVRARAWIPVGEYAARFSTWAWDIVLAPLEDNRFNRSKSNLKLLEAAAISAACLASDVQPYREFCELSDDKRPLCATKHDWAAKLRTLVHDAAMRQDIAANIHRTARKFYDAGVIKDHWIRVFELCRTL